MIEVLREKICEIFDQILDAKFRILQSHWHSLRVKKAKPICEATAELIYENELRPLKTRFKKLVWQHMALTSPKKTSKFIDAEEIKARISLEEIVKQYGVKLRKVGRYLICLCPFHSESNPSFYIYEDHFHCYGCMAHGDVIKFIQLKEGLNFKQVLEFLSSKYYG